MFNIVLQVLSGLLIIIYYASEVSSAYGAMQSYLRDKRNGFIYRYGHQQGSSTIFALMYLHMFRTLFKLLIKMNKYVWISGLISFCAYIIVSFLGYVLPWGNMSYWAAEVILSFAKMILYFSSRLSEGLYNWLIGGYYVSQNCMSRFITLHFILPILIFLVIMLHFYYLHVLGSSTVNLLKVACGSNVHFITTVLIMDLRTFAYIMLIALLQYYYNIFSTAHPDNGVSVNMLSTPLLIVPEWYLLTFYAVLKCIPSYFGLLSLISTLLVLFYPSDLNIRQSVATWFIMLMLLGGQLPKQEHSFISRITLAYALI